MKEIRQLERNAQKKLQELDRRIVHYMVDGLIEDLCESYSEMHEVVDYLRAVQEDILKNVGLFRPDRHATEKAPWLQELPFRKYQVNVIVDNSQLKNAPVVVENNPTYNNLLGAIEKEAQFGALYTDLTMIKAGSLHKANGGYLVIPAEGILKDPYSWDALKRAVRSNKIEIEELAQRLGFLATKSLKPQPIPLNVKVVLIGSPGIYYALYYYDDDFRELFKVKPEFDTHMKCNKENTQDFLSFICTFCNKEKLKHLDSTGASKLMEYSFRLAEDQEKLSTRFGALADLIREANFWAMKENTKYVKESHVKKALEEKVYRSNLMQDHIQEAIARGILLIDTDGKKTGQTNGLSVASLGDYTFSRPSRITASVGAGREGIVDIEREVKLGGPIHSKGVLILNGYLLKKYAWDKPLTLEARLVFEQSYGGIEGDSASSTELYTILSALSDLPIKQGIAVTGSVNQNGEVQAIGGVNEKIEGFFDVCKAKKLTGEQGVIIPESNVKNLMLREDVVKAVNQKKFRIWSVKTIDEGIEILTGVPAGSRSKDNKFPEGTVNYLVDKRLKEFTKSLKKISEKESRAKKSKEWIFSNSALLFLLSKLHTRSCKLYNQDSP
jgi:lon-related putative ATP-dependent protease